MTLAFLHLCARPVPRRVLPMIFANFIGCGNNRENVSCAPPCSPFPVLCDNDQGSKPWSFFSSSQVHDERARTSWKSSVENPDFLHLSVTSDSLSSLLLAFSLQDPQSWSKFFPCLLRFGYLLQVWKSGTSTFSLLLEVNFKVFASLLYFCGCWC